MALQDILLTNKSRVGMDLGERTKIGLEDTRQTVPPPPHYGTEVVLMPEGPRAGGAPHSGKGPDYFTSPVKTMTLRDIK